MSRLRLLIALLAALALVLFVACGDDDDETPAMDPPRRRQPRVPGTNPVTRSSSASAPGPAGSPGRSPKRPASSRRPASTSSSSGSRATSTRSTPSPPASSTRNSQTLNDTLGVRRRRRRPDDRAGQRQLDRQRPDHRRRRASRPSQDLKGKKIGVEAGVVDHFLLAARPAEGRPDAGRRHDREPGDRRGGGGLRLRPARRGRRVRAVHDAGAQARRLARRCSARRTSRARSRTTSSSRGELVDEPPGRRAEARSTPGS